MTVEQKKRNLLERGVTRAENILDLHARGYSTEEIAAEMEGLVSKSFIRRVVAQGEEE